MRLRFNVSLRAHSFFWVDGTERPVHLKLLLLESGRSRTRVPVADLPHSL